MLHSKFVLELTCSCIYPWNCFMRQKRYSVLPIRGKYNVFCTLNPILLLLDKKKKKKSYLEGVQTMKLRALRFFGFSWSFLDFHKSCRCCFISVSATYCWLLCLVFSAIFSAAFYFEGRVWNGLFTWTSFFGFEYSDLWLVVLWFRFYLCTWSAQCSGSLDNAGTIIFPL